MPDAIYTVRLSKEVHAELETLRRDQEWLQREGLQTVVLDFEDVGILNSLAIGHLVKLKLMLRARSIGLVLENMSPAMRRVLHHSNLGDLLGLGQELPRLGEDD